MPKDEDRQTFFVDDELVERLMRADVIHTPAKKKHAADSSALAEAVRLASDGRLDDAVMELQRTLDEGNKSVEIHAALGQLRFEQEKWSEAADSYATAAAIEPKHRSAHYNLGLCLERESKFEEAAHAFETAVSIDPKRWQAQLSRGLCLLQLGKPGPALECFKASLKERPRQDRALFGMTVALQALAGAALSRADYSAAVELCSELVKVSTDHYQGWFNLALSYEKTGRLEEACGSYREAVRIRPESVEAGVNLGVVLQMRGDSIAARRAYERALASSPETPGALWNLALLLEGDGALEEAERYFEKLVALKPDFEDAAFWLGYLQLQRGEFAGAVDSFELCLKKRGNWVEALLNLGLAYWKFEDLDAAAETFGRALALQPDNPGALRALTGIAIERRNHEQAWKLHQKLIALGQDSVELSYNLGLLLQSAGENQLAVECYQTTVKKKPGFPEALLNLGHALKAAGKEDEGHQVWSKAVAADAGLAAKYFH